MAKRTPRSQPDDTQDPAAAKAKPPRPRAKTVREAQTTADDPTVASAPTLDTTQAARPTPADERPPDAVARPAAEDGGSRVPTLDDIRRRAYDLYVKRGGGHGQHDDDWFRAERELRGKRK